MKKALLILALAGAATLPAQAAANIGISIGIQAPGQYGRIDINNYPQPTLVFAQPIVHAPSPVSAHQRPIYLYVPQRHQSNWGRYCSRYGACGQPVFFVQETWVKDEYSREHDNRNGGKKPKHKPESVTPNSPIPQRYRNALSKVNFQLGAPIYPPIAHLTASKCPP